MSEANFNSACKPSDHGRCGYYGSGHALHQIHARHIGQSPWGWRDALVVRVEGMFLTLRYLAADVEFTAWHHAELPLMPGDPVRVNQSHSAVLQAKFGQVNIAHDSPLSAVPEPEHPELWAAESSPGVVDLATGRAFNVNNEFQHGGA
jgi:hypothetical protein